MTEHDHRYLISAKMLKRAQNSGAGVLVTDYELAKAQTIHYAWSPWLEEWWASRRVTDCIEWLRDAGHRECILLDSREQYQERATAIIKIWRQ